MSPYWVRPQDFIHITGHIQAWHASTPVTTGKSHGFQEMYPGV
ncbi:trace amine-associated receptor 13c-like, partial [Tachysurus ichikawai]